MDFGMFHMEFRRQLRCISHQKLKLLSKEISAARRERYVENHNRQVELVERGFTQDEFLRFMEAVDNADARAAYMFMAVLGLRVGELMALKGGDLRGDELRISSEKGSYSAVVRLPHPLLSLLDDVTHFGPEDPIFWMSQNWLRAKMRRYLRKAGLDSVYLVTKPCGRHGKANHRQRLTPHSFRHYAIQRVFEASRDPDLARRFARHRDMKATEKYLRTSRKDEVESVISRLSESFASLPVAEKNYFPLRG